MNPYLADKLAECKNALPDQLPQTVRAKLDDTYKRIEQMGLPARKTQKEGARMQLIKIGVSTTAAALLGVVIIGSSYISPAMAQSLKQIPIVSSLFHSWGQQTGDLGIQQADPYSTPLNKSITQDGLTMNISSAVFDGTRIAMEIATPGNRIFSITNPEYGAEKRKEAPIFAKGSVEGIEALFQNHQLSLSYTMPDTSNGTNLLLQISNQIISERELQNAADIQTADFPEQMDLNVNVKLKGYETPFSFVVPLTKTTNNIVLASDEIQSYEHISQKIEKLEITPITTQLRVDYNTDNRIKERLASVPDRYKSEDGSFLTLQYEVADEQGVALKPIGLTALLPETRTINFEPFRTTPKFVMIKPYIEVPTGEPAGPNQVDSEGRVTKQVAPFNKVYVKELEVTLQVK